MRQVNLAFQKAWKANRRAQKYGNQRIVTEEGAFDSQSEYRRWCELKLLERGGQIRNLEHHVKLPLIVNGHDCGRYEADFVYFENDKRVIEDRKGGKATITDVFRLKQKLVFALYGIEVRIT
jgi:hypothetical protein